MVLLVSCTCPTITKYGAHICSNRKSYRPTCCCYLANIHHQGGRGRGVTQPSRTFLEFHHARRRSFETPSVGGPGNSRRFGPGPEQLRLFIAARPPNSSPVGVEVKERKEADTHNIRRELRTRLNIAVTSRWKKDIHCEREKKQRRDCDSHWLAAQLRIYP